VVRCLPDLRPRRQQRHLETAHLAAELAFGQALQRNVNKLHQFENDLHLNAPLIGSISTLR
jgi:hypothetical protein